ncbi:hypothetical protein [Nocardiopsis sp. FR6]|uniref:hypothetical protein n=1 Tax=Nocardiopsis sp. FR6 TaxID=2605986 RepID=UPI00135A38B4|nr:hypothetical protein [Nocardiopsis sp. FR6]
MSVTRDTGPKSRTQTPITSVEDAVGLSEYDPTARLSGAAWANSGFRAQALRRWKSNQHRTKAREPGLDADEVIRECKKAHSVHVGAGGYTLVAVLVACLLNVGAGGIVLLTALTLAAWGRFRDSGDGMGLRRVVSIVVAGFLAYVLVVMVLPWAASLFLFSAGGDEYGGTGTTVDRGYFGPGLLLPFWVVLPLLLIVTVGIGYWARWEKAIALEAIRTKARARVAKGSLVDSGVGAVPVAFYSDFSPFTGAGVPYESWPFTLKLTVPRSTPSASARVGSNGDTPEARTTALLDGHPAKGNAADTAGSTPPVAGDELLKRAYDRLRKQLSQLGATGEDGSGPAHEMEVADCVFLPGMRQDDPKKVLNTLVEEDAGKLRERWVNRFVKANHERARHFLEIGVSMWENQVVVTVFVRLTTRGGLLHIEGETLVMPPLSPAYQVPPGGSADETPLLRDSITGLVQDLGTHLSEVMTSLELLRVSSQENREYSEAWENEGYYDFAPRSGLRELTATQSLRQLFQAHDVRRVTHAIPEKVLICLRDVLKDAGYDTEQVAQVIQNINNQYNQTFEEGSIRGRNVGVNEPTFDQRTMSSSLGPAKADK